MSSGTYPSMVRAWTRSSSLLFSGLLEANRAAVATFNHHSAETAPSCSTTVSPGGVLEDWSVERDIERDSTVSVGDSVEFSKELSAADVERFALASGDTNPIHLDDEHAGATRFGGRIVHGILATGLISAGLAQLPGDIVYLSQDVEFLRPVEIGAQATATVSIAESLGNDRYRLRTQLHTAPDELAIDGEAIVLVDSPPE